MKLLIYHCNSLLQYDIREICKEKNIDFTIIEWNLKSKNCDEQFTKWFCDTMGEGEYDALLSINYYPVLSEVCMKKQIKYIAWCCDTLLNVERIAETLNNPVNYVFLFDKMEFWQYAQQGFETVYHLPLGVNRTRVSQLKIADAEYEKYAAEVSFVGKLYENILPELMSPLDDYTKGYLQAVITVQSQLYGSFLLDKLIMESMVNNMNVQYQKRNPNTNVQVCKASLIQTMSEEITRKERIILLNLCGNKFHTKLYSNDKDTFLQNVIECGPVNYITETPKVYACSKVNLNPSLKCIQTGIPLRVFEVMGAGGFLLTNYQEELLEHYENETDIVIYESMEDALEKIQFYLNHEDLRCKIAENGRRKTLENHSLQDCMAVMFKTAELL